MFRFSLFDITYIDKECWSLTFFEIGSKNKALLGIISEDEQILISFFWMFIKIKNKENNR